jgi:hypothetical protein
MRAGAFLLGLFAALCGLVVWFLWDRTLHFSLWVDYLSPCIFSAILMVGFAGLYRRDVEVGRIAGEDGFGPFMKRHALAYAGLLGAAMVALWAREGFEAIPYILFFGLPYFGGIFAATAVIALLSHFWPVIRTLFLWFWLGFGVCYGASCLAMAGGSWTAIPFALLVVPGLVRGRRQLFALSRSPWLWCLASAALTLGWWYHDGFWQIPWRVTRVPYGLIPWAAGAGVVIWAAHRFGGGAVRRAASALGSWLASAVVVTVFLFAGAGGWDYLVRELSWREMVRYKVVFDAESAAGTRRETSVITVERKVLPFGRTRTGALRMHGSLPSMHLPGKGVLRAELQMDYNSLRALPVIAREALRERSGEPSTFTDTPMELVGKARPELWVTPASNIWGRRISRYEDNGLGVRFRIWIEVLKGAGDLDKLFVARKERG